ncbi:hypothetical protein SAMN05216499_1115 [Actinacidiphila paucisporea]|uniref:Uncharacterized protein n=1 Tax=Actinacidiphila paucisporea TaxID=310782 RepID=A0A1M7IQJ0_9ACTN|nr:hypothetical protein SAMN05216499_1115 [Actinacidiphila paucisporea]
MQGPQAATVTGALQIMASMGVTEPSQLRPHMVCRRIDPYTVRSHEELYEWLSPGHLQAEPPASWAADWAAADPDRFTV